MNYTDKELTEIADRFREERHMFSAPLVVSIGKMIEDLVETRRLYAENAVALEQAREDFQDMGKRVDQAQVVLLRLARELRDARAAPREAKARASL